MVRIIQTARRFKKRGIPVSMFTLIVAVTNYYHSSFKSLHYRCSNSALKTCPARTQQSRFSRIFAEFTLNTKKRTGMHHRLTVQTYNSVIIISMFYSHWIKIMGCSLSRTISRTNSHSQNSFVTLPYAKRLNEKTVNEGYRPVEQLIDFSFSPATINR